MVFRIGEMAVVAVNASVVAGGGVAMTRTNWGTSIRSRNSRVHTGLGQNLSPFSPVRCSGAGQLAGQVLTEDPAVEFRFPDNSVAWKGFVERASGEWDGYGADFNFLGEPIELPSQVVPEAFREWGVAVHDWQTMCPTLGQTDAETLGYRVIRLLPTVGCEADAATTYCTEERELSTTDTCAFHPNGSYTAVWLGKGVVKNNSDTRGPGKVVLRDFDNKNDWEVEHCLVNERGKTRTRARILQQFRVDYGTNAPQLKNITVYVENWDGPFRNGESLGGCSTSGSGFATTAPLELPSLAGTWHVNSFGADTAESVPKLLDFRGSSNVERSEVAKVVALPKNLWSSVKASEASPPSYIIEAGWLVDPEQSIVSSLEYLPSGEFQAMSIRFEKKT